jgi:hypothetical protein
VQRAFRQKALKHHPDKTTDPNSHKLYESMVNCRDKVIELLDWCCVKDENQKMYIFDMLDVTEAKFGKVGFWLLKYFANHAARLVITAPLTAGIYYFWNNPTMLAVIAVTSMFIGTRPVERSH